MENTRKKSRAYSFFLALLVLVALRISTFNTFASEPTQRTFSAIGRMHPRWFVAWGMVTGVALVLNIKFLSRKVGFGGSSLDRWMALAFLAGVVNVFVNPPYGFGNGVHIWAALIGSFTFFMTMSVLFFVASRKYNTKVGYAYFVIMMVSLAAYGIGFLWFGGLVAIMQIQMFWVAGVCLLAMNFFHRFDDGVAERVVVGDNLCDRGA